MKPIKIALLAVFGFFLIPISTATSAPDKNKTISTLIFKIDNHTNTRNADGNFNTETFMNTMLVSNRPVSKRLIASTFLMNRRSVSDNDAVSNTLGVNTILIFNKNSLGMIGYSHSSNAERTAFTPGVKSDRLSFNLIHTFNPDEKKGPQYSLSTSYGTLTNWGDQQSLSEKLGVKFPINGEKLTGAFSYRFSYSLNKGEQSSNQLNGSVTLKMKEARLAFGVSFFNNVFSGERGDDTVFDVTWIYSGL